MVVLVCRLVDALYPRQGMHELQGQAKLVVPVEGLLGFFRALEGVLGLVAGRAVGVLQMVVQILLAHGPAAGLLCVFFITRGFEGHEDIGLDALCLNGGSVGREVPGNGQLYRAAIVERDDVV